MKRFVPLLAVVLAGCVIHSIEPFYTAKSQVLPKEVLGRWRLVTSSGLDVSANNIRPWTIEEAADNRCKLVACDSKNLSGTFLVTFFKIGADLYFDYVPTEPGEETKLNEYWALAVHPVHGVCKVMLQTNQIQFAVLDYNWVTSGLAKRQFILPHNGTTNDLVLFTAKPKDWEAFLRKYGNDWNAFPAKSAFVLRRVTGAPAK